MLYGRKVSGNSCRISEKKEAYFWKREFHRQQYPHIRNGNTIVEINRSPHILEEAKRNLIEHFLLWGPQSEIEEFFCILGQLLGKRKKWRINNIIKGRKTSYSKAILESDLYTEVNNRLALELNQLDNELYQWGNAAVQIDGLTTDPPCSFISQIRSGRKFPAELTRHSLDRARQVARVTLRLRGWTGTLSIRARPF
ncbi:unnamed protein product [Bathycoccus prasinos]